MKVLLVLQNYLPVKNGGIENYTHWLAKILYENQFDVTVCYLNIGESESYIYEGITVVKLFDKFKSFQQILTQKIFDICHFHEYSGEEGIGPRWFKEAKMFCNKVFFTFHLPYLTCYKGDFRYYNTEDCNTFSSYERCVKCVIATRLGYKKGNNLTNLAINASMPFLEKSSRGKLLKEKILKVNKNFDEVIESCTSIFIYADWFKILLQNNGYKTDKLVTIPYITKTTTLQQNDSISTIKNKILFVARIEPQKGLHLLCKAMNRINTNNIQLDVFGNIVDQAYYDKCVAEYNFNFMGTTNRLKLLELLPTYDFLILPSVFPEMYSMIVKDSFYEGLPVIASASKGNRNAIVEGKNGFIFEYDNFEDLAKVIDKAYSLRNSGWKPDFDIASSVSTEVALKDMVSHYL
jgi:glycosyltransferase involved in cell wall biosynthesis